MQFAEPTSTVWLAEMKSCHLAISFSLCCKAHNVFLDYLDSVFTILCLTVASLLNILLCIVDVVLTSDLSCDLI